MPRYFIEISYNGANYGGWQIQANSSSVQSCIQEVMSKILRQPISIMGSSRTDAGVHALHQVAQVDSEAIEDLEQFIFLMNRALPPSISILGMYQVATETQARFDALSRSYRYVICRRKDPFWYKQSWEWFGKLDIESMQKAAELIQKEDDFEAFSKIHTQVNHFRCNIHSAAWRQDGHLLLFEITANRFLRGMVRGLVGTMMAVGKGRLNLDDLESIFKSKDRKKAGENAPANGLFLTKVDYPSSIRI